MSEGSKIIGIDLGTTNSVVAVMMGSEGEVIPNAEGSNRTPSVVAFLDDGEVVVGEIARRQAATNAARTVSSIKRLMGHSLEELEEAGEYFPYRLVSHDDQLFVDVDGMGYRPQQLSALILKKLKESAEDYLGGEVRHAVITVPAYFDDLQRQATKAAAEMAGLEVLRLISEPTAAAIAYGLGRSESNEETIAVYDFGGGTFDITILEITGRTFEVLTSTGDSHLGGDDLDNAIVDLIVKEFQREHGVDLGDDPVTIRRLKEVAERAKCELSSTTQTVMSLPFISYKDGQPLHLDRTITRDEFEDLIDEFVRLTVRCCKRALEEAKLTRDDINKVILVGGTTRIPLVQDSVEEFFDQEAFRGVNPDEVVAIGAATQGAIFEGNVQEVTLLDVTPHSLGIEVEGGVTSVIIEKNSTIPIKAAKTFTTTEDDQEFVNIHVLQGESREAAENRSLGKFILRNIPEAKAGEPRIRVTFFINADGVMEISAEEMKTGAAEEITIVHSQLSEEERKRRSRRRARSLSRRGGTRRGSGTGRGRRRTGTGSGTRSDARTGVRKSDETVTPTRVKSSTTAGSTDRRRASSPDAGGATAAPAETGVTRDSGQEFAMLGDTNPGEGVGVQARDTDSLPTLDPVDYTKAPPMYSHMQREKTGPRPQAGAASKSDPEPASRPGSVPREGTESPTTEKRRGVPAVPVTEFDEEQHDEPVHAAPGEMAETVQMQRPGGTESDDGGHPAAGKRDRDRNSASTAPRAGEIAGIMASDDEVEVDTEKIDLPEPVLQAISLAGEKNEDKEAMQAYAEAVEALSKPPLSDQTGFDVLHARALLHAMMGQLLESQKELSKLRTSYVKRHGEEILALCGQIIERFGPAPSLLRERALAREKVGDLAGASADFEQANREDPQEGDLPALERLYRARVDQTADRDPQAQFKLVKVLLKSNRVDEAIEILQDLQKVRNYETRSLKILGLCHWQKSMHYQAWQKFRALPIDDDLEDILYRLAQAMEESNQLQDAVEVLEHLIAARPGYRDAEARLRKLSYRLKLQREEIESSADLPILSKDNRFVIHEEINRGSMGIIYKAEDKVLNEIVAIKVLNDYLCSDPSAVERFKSEARAARKLSHPYIVRIHDLFEADNKRFISMEYIEGTDLKHMLGERTNFTEEMILYYFLQICDALSYAHKLGIVHRDIKPANIMITNRNTVKITDFGIAKILRSEDATKTGTAVIGTPLYMAPEQIIGDPVDARTDIYSLGIMMYELVSDNPPFYLGNIEYHHIHTAPPALPERVSPRLREVIMKMISKRKEDRYQSVDQIIPAVKTG